MGQQRTPGLILEGMEETFSKMNLREDIDADAAKNPSLRLCSVYLHDLIGFLPRETCGGLRLVSGFLDDELSMCSMLPKKALKSINVTLMVSPRAVGDL